MRVHRPRIRTLMTAVALLGAIYLAVSLGMRRARLLERAAYHEAQAARYYDARPDATPTRLGMRLVRVPGPPATFFVTGPGLSGAFFFADPARPRTFFRVAGRGEWHLQAAARYHEAARRPWLPVPPDPPAPE